MLRLWVCLVVLAFSAGIARPSFAETQEQEAAELERQGREAFSAEDFTGAAEKFDAANRLAPHAQLRFNAALAWEKARQPARAADAYEGALRQGGLDEQRTERAEASLAALKATLGYVKVSRPVSGVLSVAHLARAPIPAQFHLAPGQYEVEIEGPDGTKSTKTVAVKAGEVVSIEVEAEAARPSVAIQRRKPPPVERPREEMPSSSARSTWGWIALGSGVVFGGVAAYFGTQTLKASQDYEDSGNTDSDARDRGVRNRAITNVALAGSVIGVGVGGYLLLTGGSKKSGKTTRIGLKVSGPRLDAAGVLVEAPVRLVESSSC